MDKTELQKRAGITEGRSLPLRLLPLPYPLTLDEISKELDYVRQYIEGRNTIVAITYLDRLQKALQDHGRSGYSVDNTRDE